MPTWPSSLPQGPEYEYSESPPDLTSRTEMDAGPAKVRRRFTAGVRTFDLTFTFSRDQLATFETFYMNEIGSGSVPFTFPAIRGTSTFTARITSLPVYKPIGFYFKVSFNMEQLP